MRSALLVLLAALAACGDGDDAFEVDGGSFPVDAARPDARPDAAFHDAALVDASVVDAPAADAFVADASLFDASVADADPMLPDAGPPPAQVTIPAGSFFMGCAPGDVNCRFDEVPGRTVTLAAYQIDRLEVRQSAWADCVAAGPCALPAANYTPEATPDAPVRDVTFAEAQTYCGWLGFRLPSEAEWERAARGDRDARAYPWGHAAPTCALAGFAGCGAGYTVGSHPAGRSPFGVEDLAGGVRELVGDYYQNSYGGLPASNPSGPASGSQRVMRGGSFASADWTLRTTTRAVADPVVPYDDTGLRCARDVP